MEINLTYKQVDPVFEYMGSKFIDFEYCVSIFETNNLPQDSGILLNCPLFAGDSVTDSIICLLAAIIPLLSSISGWDGVIFPDLSPEDLNSVLRDSISAGKPLNNNK